MLKLFKSNMEKRMKMCKKIVEEIRTQSYNIDTVEQAAQKLLSEYKHSGFVPIVRIIVDAGFKIFYQDMPKEIGGYIIIGDKFQEKLGSDKIIVINEKEDYNRQRFSLAHEFGHFLLDDNAKQKPEYYNAFESDDNKSELEILINRFAAELLMPKEEFKKEYQKALQNTADVYEIYKSLSDPFRVPFVSVKRRIEEVGQ